MGFFIDDNLWFKNKSTGEVWTIDSSDSNERRMSIESLVSVEDIDDNRDGNNLSELDVDFGKKEESYTVDEEHQETSYDSQYDSTTDEPDNLNQSDDQIAKLASAASDVADSDEATVQYDVYEQDESTHIEDDSSNDDVQASNDARFACATSDDMADADDNTVEHEIQNTEEFMDETEEDASVAVVEDGTKHSINHCSWVS